MANMSHEQVNNGKYVSRNQSTMANGKYVSRNESRMEKIKKLISTWRFPSYPLKKSQLYKPELALLQKEDIGGEKATNPNIHLRSHRCAYNSMAHTDKDPAIREIKICLRHVWSKYPILVKFGEIKWWWQFTVMIISVEHNLCRRQLAMTAIWLY